MPKKLSVEERVKKLKDERESVIEKRVEKFRSRMEALYDAKIDLLREKGLPPKKTGSLSIEGMVAKAKERYMFYRYRFWIHMGLPEDKAKAKAEVEYIKYKAGWLSAMGKF